MKACIIGKNGFIGSALAKKFDIVTSTPTKDCDVIIDMGSPVHPPFEENPDFYIKTLLPRHLYFLTYGVYYIYPSSALVYEEKEIAFTYFKRTLEELAKGYANNLGVRIFPVYGPGENRTAISQWCKAMKKGERPIVYGDGTQKRDFIYIDDVADGIYTYILQHKTGVVDIGRGEPIAFNNIIATINKVLGTKLEPIYHKTPSGYSEGIYCKNPIITRVSMEDGIRKILLEQ